MDRYDCRGPDSARDGTRRGCNRARAPRLDSHARSFVLPARTGRRLGRGADAPPARRRLSFVRLAQLCRALEARLGPPLQGGHPSPPTMRPTGVEKPPAWPRVALRPSPGSVRPASGSVTRIGRIDHSGGCDGRALCLCADPERRGPRGCDERRSLRAWAASNRVGWRSEAARAHGQGRSHQSGQLSRPRRLSGVGPRPRTRSGAGDRGGHGVELLGRGGAAFPTGRKWDAVRRQPAMPHYVVCNADESEPGTFKDRVLMGSDPFAVVEAMTICGLATDEHARLHLHSRRIPARRGADRRRHRAGARRRPARSQRDGIGPRVRHRNPPRWRRLHLRRGDGALQFDRRQARRAAVEAAVPGAVGVFGKPTVANNVETLVNVLDIVNEGGAAWATTGTPGSTGHPLVLPLGSRRAAGPLRIAVRRDAARGRSSWPEAWAVAGRSRRSCWAAPRARSSGLRAARHAAHLRSGARAAGTTLGSGVVMVFDETADIGDALQRHGGVLPRTNRAASVSHAASEPCAAG